MNQVDDSERAGEYRPYPLDLISELDSHLHDRATSRPGETAATRATTARRISELLTELAAYRAPRRGDVVAGARLESVIASGDFGTVWRAIRLETSEPCAVKAFHPEGLGKGRMAREFRQGVAAMRALTSMRPPPSVVQLIDCDDANLTFSMTLVEGRDLTDVATRGWTLSKKLEVFKELCRATKFAHDNQVIHRDIKPANVVMDASDRPVLTDFDLADLLTLRTLTMRSSGSLAYAAPEQLEPGSNAESDRRHRESDIYSLGRILFFLLVESDPSGVFRRAIEELPELKDFPGLQRIVRRATLKDATRRYSSVDELLVDVARHSEAAALVGCSLDTEPPDHALLPIPPKDIGRRKKSVWKSRTIIAAIIVAIATVVAAVVGKTDGHRSPDVHPLGSAPALVSLQSPGASLPSASTTPLEAPVNALQCQDAGAPPQFVEGVGILQVAQLSFSTQPATAVKSQATAQMLRMGNLLMKRGGKPWRDRLFQYQGRAQAAVQRVAFNNVAPAAGEQMCKWLQCEHWSGGCEFVSENGETTKTPNSYPGVGTSPTVGAELPR